jgi:hypothetical protein
MYDIVFISYNEISADENYAALKYRFPMAKRVHGVKGIHQAHVKAAKKCFSKMFWVVDADAKIVEGFNFDYVVPDHQLDHVHVWRSINPINGLEYGYGGVKLLPRVLTANMDMSNPDMTTSISNNFKPMTKMSNITAFNTDPFNTWKSAFRECCKLSSKTIRGQIDDETEERLRVWCETGSNAMYGKYAIHGACSGRNFGYDNCDKPDRLKLINDFDWLKEQFNAVSI